MPKARGSNGGGRGCLAGGVRRGPGAAGAGLGGGQGDEVGLEGRGGEGRPASREGGEGVLREGGGVRDGGACGASEGGPVSDAERDRLVAEDPDWIACRRFDHSVKTASSRHPDGCPARVIAAALAMKEEDVPVVYEKIAAKLKRALDSL